MLTSLRCRGFVGTSPLGLSNAWISSSGPLKARSPITFTVNLPTGGIGVLTSQSSLLRRTFLTRPILALEELVTKRG